MAGGGCSPGRHLIACGEYSTGLAVKKAGDMLTVLLRQVDRLQRTADGVQKSAVWCRMGDESAAGAFGGRLAGSGVAALSGRFLLGRTYIKQSVAHAKPQLD